MVYVTIEPVLPLPLFVQKSVSEPSHAMRVGAFWAVAMVVFVVAQLEAVHS